MSYIHIVNINNYVLSEKRRMSIGTSIFLELLSLSTFNNFQFAASSKDISTALFLEKFGFDIVENVTPYIKKGFLFRLC